MVKLKGRLVSIFTIITILISSFLVSAVAQNNKIDASSESSSLLGSRVQILKGGWIVGNATSGKQYGILGRIGIIKFDNVSFYRIRLPIRFEMANFTDVTIFIIGLDQEIPESSFDFKREWFSIAIVFK